MPVPGTPNGGCNYHCSATDLSVHSPTKQEEPFGILHQKLRPLIAEQKGGRGGQTVCKTNEECPKERRGEWEWQVSGWRLLHSSCWCQVHRCWFSICTEVSHAAMLSLKLTDLRLAPVWTLQVIMKIFYPHQTEASEQKRLLWLLWNELAPERQQKEK